MNHSLFNLIRALALVLLFVPAPLVAIGATPAVADSGTRVTAAEPAVVVPEGEEAPSEDPWTARFLAPLVLVVGVVSLGAAASYYVVRIKGRYRVV